MTGTFVLLVALLLATASACTTDRKLVRKEVIVRSRECRINASLRLMKCACFLFFKNGLITSAQTALCQILYKVKDLSVLGKGCKSNRRSFRRLLFRLRTIAVNCFKPFPSPSPSPTRLAIAPADRVDLEDDMSLLRQNKKRFTAAGFDKCLKCLSCIQIGNCVIQNED